MDFRGAVLLRPDTAEVYRRQQFTQLIRVGGRLAVLGVEGGVRSAGWWHVCRPGTWDAPQGISGTQCEGDDLVYAKSICGKTVVSNGYAADWRPPQGALCPACAEQI